LLFYAAPNVIVPVPPVNTDTLSDPSVNGELVASTTPTPLVNVKAELYRNIITPEPPDYPVSVPL
jgi:hypothetical protein